MHTNSNLFLASGSTLTLADRVTAVGEVIRTTLSNGWDTDSSYLGTVRAITAPGAFRDLGAREGSLVGGIGSATNEPLWTNLSTGTYNHNIMNGRTGAQPARPADRELRRRRRSISSAVRLPNENVTNPNMLTERFYSLASLRILLSDNAADITGLPGVSATRAGRRSGSPSRDVARLPTHSAVCGIAGLPPARA